MDLPTCKRQMDLLFFIYCFFHPNFFFLSSFQTFIQLQFLWTYALLAALEPGQPAQLLDMLRTIMRRCLAVATTLVRLLFPPSAALWTRFLSEFSLSTSFNRL